MCLLWAIALGGGPADPSVAETRAPAASFSAELEERYREILRAWAGGAEGDSSRATAELTALQEELGSTAAVLRCWRDVRDHTHRRLARREPDAVFALIHFHHLAYADQMEPVGRDLQLAESTKESIYSLLRLHRRRSAASTVGRDELTVLWVALAARFGSHAFQNLIEDSLRSFQAALALEPEHEAALYGASFLEEKTGRYGQAVRHLEALIRSRPEDVEIRFRLALNRARTGHLEAASVTFEKIARGDGPPHFRILAYQELARIHGEPRPEVAIAFLDEALQIFPGDFQLALQRSFLFRDDWRRAVAETEALAADWSPRPGDSARLIYEKIDQSRFRETRLRLVRIAERTRPALAAALDQLAASETRRKSFRPCRGVAP